MIAVRAWDRSSSVYGITTGTEPGGGGLQYACQACGRGFHSASSGLSAMVVAPLGLMFLAISCFLLLIALVGWSVVLLGVALLTAGFGAALTWPVLGPWVQEWRHPVVPDAPMPALRYTGEEPTRRCSCGEAAVCREVTANRTNGVYTGTEYAFQCPACERTFTIESPMSTVSAITAGTVCGIVAAVAVPATGAGASDWLCTGVTALLALGAVLMVSGRLVNRLRHPKLPVRPLPPTGPGGGVRTPAP